MSQTSSVTEWQWFQNEDVMVRAVMLQADPGVSDRLHQPQSCVVVPDSGRNGQNCHVLGVSDRLHQPQS